MFLKPILYQLLCSRSERNETGRVIFESIYNLTTKFKQEKYLCWQNLGNSGKQKEDSSRFKQEAATKETVS